MPIDKYHLQAYNSSTFDLISSSTTCIMKTIVNIYIKVSNNIEVRKMFKKVLDHI